MSWLLRDPNWAPAMDLAEAHPAERRLAGVAAGRATVAVPTVARDIVATRGEAKSGVRIRERDEPRGCGY